MTYTHYGEIGDVWKHLPLAEILALERPQAYWESHAASGLYELTPGPNQQYGAIQYVERAESSRLLKRSPYTELIDSYRNAEGELVHYPGSPVLAMHVLEQAQTTTAAHPTYLFCDIEEAAVRSIREQAREFQIQDSRINTVHGDGISALFEALSTASSEELEGTFAHIDPYAPMDVGEGGRSGWDLFRALLEEGARAMLWYGYQTADEETRKDEFFEEKIGTSDFDGERHDLWISEIVVDAFADPETNATHPGVFGSGVICGNVGEHTIDRCREGGEALVSIYADAVLPDGNDGSLSYTEPRY